MSDNKKINLEWVPSAYRQTISKSNSEEKPDTDTAQTPSCLVKAFHRRSGKSLNRHKVCFGK